VLDSYLEAKRQAQDLVGECISAVVNKKESSSKNYESFQFSSTTSPRKCLRHAKIKEDRKRKQHIAYLQKCVQELDAERRMLNSLVEQFNLAIAIAKMKTRNQKKTVPRLPKVEPKDCSSISLYHSSPGPSITKTPCSKLSSSETDLYIKTVEEIISRVKNENAKIKTALAVPLLHKSSMTTEGKYSLKKTPSKRAIQFVCET